jgi:hypothetical protein
MSTQGRGNSGKWLAGGLVVLGLIAAVVGWKFRKLSPRPALPPPPPPPPTTAVVEPP